MLFSWTKKPELSEFIPAGNCDGTVLVMGGRNNTLRLLLTGRQLNLIVLTSAKTHVIRQWWHNWKGAKHAFSIAAFYVKYWDYFPRGFVAAL